MPLESSRLRFARVRRGLTKKLLCERSGLSLRTLSTLENETDSDPNEETIAALADALGFPVDFFQGDVLEIPSHEAVSFRSLKSLTARQRDSALASAAIAIELLGPWIEERFTLPDPSIPVLPELGPEAAAAAVRSEWGLGAGPVGNVIHHLEAHGVRVFSLVEECKAVDAFSLRRDGKPFVFLNTFKTAERSRMDAAHELGHMVLHPSYDRSVSRQLEQEATEFASAFLMPADGLVGRHSRFPDLIELIEAKHQWAVAVTAYVYRLHALEQISDWHYRTLFKTMSRLGYRRAEPNGIARETSSILTQVLKHLRLRGITSEDVAEQLAVSRPDLDASLFGLAFFSLPGGGQSQSVKPKPHLSVVPTR